MISSGASALSQSLQKTVDDCNLTVMEYLLSIGIPRDNINLKIVKSHKNSNNNNDLSSINECYAILKYLKYLRKNQNVKILRFDELSNKIGLNEIIKFEPFKSMISPPEKYTKSYLVPLQMVISVDKEENEYISIIRYNRNTNQIYPLYF